MQIQQRTQVKDSELGEEVHPVLRRIYAARGVVNEADLRLELGELLPPSQLKNCHTAADLLLTAMYAGKKILVVGDFDADGATSSALLVLCMRAFGYDFVDYLVPNRFQYGYGLTPEIVEVALASLPDLMVTVDNGISSIEGVRQANKAGVDVLVTDHHLPGAELPEASCILNPNQPGCEFPSKALAGVGVVFYLMSSLRSALREQHWFESRGIAEPNMASFLDLVALGTVADVVPLDQNNRRLVKHGLGIIRSGKGRLGIRALLEVAGRNPNSVVANDLAFGAGPRLNAAGRLDDMSLGIECLLTDNPGKARELAVRLDGLNKDRRQIEQEMQAQAMDALQHLDIGDVSQLGICLYDSHWHQGVIGILASRIKEKFHRPCIVFADAGGEEDGSKVIKGSARSIEGLHIRDVLDALATRHPALLQKFGGHAMGEADYVASFAADIALLDQVGARPVVVHGGGPQIGEMLAKLEIESNFVDGLRVTDEATISVVEMVLAGGINKALVAAIARAGGRAVGISGKDGGLIRARKLLGKSRTEGSAIEQAIDLGFVGEPEQINTDVLDALNAGDLIPVVAPVGSDAAGETYNINADTAAGAIAAALGATRMLMLTDVAGVLDKEGELITELTVSQAESLIRDGTVSGGMIPKVETCINAVLGGAEAAVIMDGRAPHALLVELFTEHGMGTIIKAD